MQRSAQQADNATASNNHTSDFDMEAETSTQHGGFASTNATANDIETLFERVGEILNKVSVERISSDETYTHEVIFFRF